MPTVFLPIIPGTLPPGACYGSEQQRLNDFAAHLQAQLDGQSFYNIGDTVPAVEFQGYPWFRTVDYRWYIYDGAWISLNPYRDANERRLFVGTSAQVNLYDGGDNGVPSDRSGPMWEIDTAFNGRVPIGPGALPTSGTVLSVATNYGADQVTLLANQLPATIPMTVATNDWGSGPTTPDVLRLLSDNEYVDPSPLDVTSDFTIAGGGQPHSVLNPVRGCYLLKPTGRLYYKV